MGGCVEKRFMIESEDKAGIIKKAFIPSTSFRSREGTCFIVPLMFIRAEIRSLG